MIDDWMPAFAKLPPRREPDIEDQVKLDPGALSLDGLQAIYRNPALPLATRMRAMISAIPYESPKLIATAVMNEGSFAELLDRRLVRMKQMKQIEGMAINGNAVVSDPTLVEEPRPTPPLPSPLTRIYSSRFRRRI
jgi:hypothetical protein